jgi:hypothetical protein
VFSNCRVSFPELHVVQIVSCSLCLDPPLGMLASVRINDVLIGSYSCSDITVPCEQRVHGKSTTLAFVIGVEDNAHILDSNNKSKSIDND